MSNINATQTWKDLLPQIQGLVESSNYKKLISTLGKILTSHDKNHQDSILPENVRSTFTSIYIRSLLKSGNYLTAYEQCLKENNDNLLEEEAYALYRLKRYDNCLDLCEKAMKKGISGNALLHTKAQCLYRLHRTNDALDIYTDMKKSNKSSNMEDEENEEISTNALACLQSTFDKLVPHPSTHDWIHKYLPQSINQDNEMNYDLAYNYGSFLCLSSLQTSFLLKGQKMLQLAEKECQSQMKMDMDENNDDAISKQEMMEELLPIQANLAFAYLLNGNYIEADQLLESILTETSNKSHWTPSVQSARISALNNIDIRRTNMESLSLFDSMKRLPLPTNQNSMNTGHVSSDEKLQQVFTPLMLRSLLYNKAILLYKMGKEDDCLDVLKVLASGNVMTSESVEIDRGNDDNTKKRGKKKVTKKKKSTKEDNSLGIKLYSEIMEVELLRIKGETDKASEILAKLSNTYEGMLKAEVDLYQAQMKLMEKDDNMEAIKMLENFQETNSTLQSKPAIIATLISMYSDLNKTKEVSNLLSFMEKNQKEDLSSQKALGEYYLRLGMYKKSADVFQAIIDNAEGINDEMKNECLAYLVIALSYLDAEAAEEISASLVAIDEVDDYTNDNALDGEQLEEMDIPWVSGSSNRRILQHARDSNKGRKKKERNKEAILRSRARKREAYLAKLTAEGKYNPENPTKPDPERWIPKKQRSYHRRRRNRKFGAGTSHQGIGSGGLDDKKLDARARAAGEIGNAGNNAPSTAHMTVSSGGGNFKKSRKGGKKR